MPPKISGDMEERFSGKDLDIYKELLENYWVKGYLSDLELKKLEQKKLKLNLPEELTRKMEKEVEDKARERARLDIIDMGISHYRTSLEHMWKKTYLTEEDKRLIAAQREEYKLPEAIARQIEKEVEINASINSNIEKKKLIKKSLTDYKVFLERLWAKGYLSDKDNEVIESYEKKHNLPVKEAADINSTLKKKYGVSINSNIKKISTIGKKNLTDRLNLKSYIHNNTSKYTTFVSREKELEELLSYYMSADKNEQVMVKWALINSISPLKDKLKKGELEWATPSFIKSLKKARTVMPEDRKELIAILDAIIKGVSKKDKNS